MQGNIVLSVVLLGVVAVLVLCGGVDGTVVGLKPNAVPQLRVSGSMFDVGRAVGITFGAGIKETVATSGGLQRIKTWVAGTSEGKAAFAALTKSVQDDARFSPYLDELRGVANGTGIAMDDLLMLNMMYELGSLAGSRPGPQLAPSCSDMLVITKDGELWLGHNEDGGESSLGRMYMVVAQLPNGESYASYNYPGELSSNAFAYNSNGVFFSTNALFPEKIGTTGSIPRNFLQRYILAASNLTDAYNRAIEVTLASGFSINLGSVRDKRLFNIELANGAHDAFEVTSGTSYAHFNMYKRLKVAQYTDPSTVARQKRFDELPPPTGPASIFNILGDQQNKEYPIYRDGAPPDTGVVTLTTALFSSAFSSLELVMNNPKTAQPLFSLPLSDPTTAA